MAALEPDTQKIQVRVVYDGPALAGKTTNVQALCKAFTDRRRSDLLSPGTTGDRTLFLDWLQVDTGLVSGRRLSCHFITVPGQRVLSRRREFLLNLADVVVFVCSAEPGNLSDARSSFDSIRRRMSSTTDFPLVVQLNKTDCPSPMSEDRLRRELELGSDIPVVSAIATANAGVRETAVLAIRKAADRVQDQVLRSGLESLDSPLGDAETLRQWIVDHEKADGRSPLEVVLQAAPLATKQERLSTEGTREHAGESIPLPADNVPSGMVWPANLGRDYLKRALGRTPEARTVEARTMDEGEERNRVLMYESGFWSLSTLPSNVLTPDDARAALLLRARASLQLGPLCLPRLVWCVSQNDQERAWIWRVAPDPASLMDHLSSSLARQDETRTWRLLTMFLEAICELQNRKQHLEVGRRLKDLAVLKDRVHCFQWLDDGPAEPLDAVLAEPLRAFSLEHPIRNAYTEDVSRLFGTAVADDVRGLADATGDNVSATSTQAVRADTSNPVSEENPPRTGTDRNH